MRHPCVGERGEPVIIACPSVPTPLAAWMDGGALASVVPDGPMPAMLNGVEIADWTEAAQTNEGWGALAPAPVPQPPFTCPPGLAAAAGAVIVEPDGRIWLVSPTNGFGGYAATFPKGRIDPGTALTCAALQCAAMREAYEESGLRVEIVGYLTDSRRTLTYTRYYIARRVGGNPARMGWESQAVHLVPMAQLARVANHPNDGPVIAALARWVDAT